MPRERQRQYQTTITYEGYAYTRSYNGRRRDTYRCSVYRSRPCPARLSVLKDGNRFRAGTITLIDRHTCDTSSRLTPRTADARSRASSQSTMSPPLQLSQPTFGFSDDEHDMSDVERDGSFDYDPDDRLTRISNQGSVSSDLADMDDDDGFSDDDKDELSRRVRALISQANTASHSVVSSQPAIGACLNGGSRVYGHEFEQEFVEVIDAQPLMEKETDRLAILFPDKTASEIWDLIHEAFYAHHTNEIRRGLTKEQVIKRV
ncbi:hypothetical protein PINS_up014216 [Pythium insidiosum]|nr:hypothetical protein PINS_up014216 [Pythium insidiosum]